jgi:hypothetical protein
VTGYATTRSVQQIECEFIPVAGTNIGPMRVVLNSGAAFNAWYESPQSQASGGQFTATIPFTLSGSMARFANLVNALQSVNLRISNAQGASETVTVPIQ